ncbi:rhomboid family intramembrane serine protease [Motilimonas sp. E26]|uniref:rhomboid family intramembrane serine protease n=1 Tax=Motilimonas sp. E26 TaxID=2865674 RepID=UPI001E4D8370|nr:rhomboid family intramembrane serine protease [Motilimonas sp. E26]MCE0555824.1 rhomboid family intramembrane serine protease [Motilimonas sp. E26]
MPNSTFYKQCPCCKNQPLKQTQYQHQEVDVCTDCGGLWFEGGELEASYADQQQQHSLKGNIGDYVGCSDRSCPDCQHPLETFKIIDNFDVEIDLCTQCNGVWIDKDELKEVERTPHLRSAMIELNKTNNFASYIFQFITQMPVEYNIKPRNFPIVTVSLIVLNLCIFFVTLSGVIDEETLSKSLVMDPIYFADAPWTLISYQFLHGSWLHILGNMYFLYVIGDNLEDALGKTTYLLLYLFFGIVGGLAFYAIHLGEMAPMVGASGAIAGLFGVYLMLFKKAKLSFMFIVYQARLPAWAYFLIWLGINVYGFVASSEGVAWSAHIGGFIAGLIAGKIYYSKVMKNNPVIAFINDNEINLASNK